MEARISFWKVLVITSFVSGLAAAQTPIGLNNKTLPTDFSGKSKATKRTLSKSYSENGAITGLVADEDSDDPCYLELKYVDVVTRQPQNSLKFADCAGKNGDPKRGVASARKDISLTGGRLATGVRAVLNKDGDKLKGVQLIGNFGECVLGAKEFTLSVSDCSSVFGVAPYRRDTLEYRLCNTGSQPSSITVSCDDTRVESNPWFERTNAAGNSGGPDSDWEKTVSCPNGMVATGMKLNLKIGSGNRQMINGLALECNALKVR
jgi:hypothetical protein